MLPKIDRPLTATQLRHRVLEHEYGPVVIHEFQTGNEWSILQCSRCGHVWNDLDPEAEACACLDVHGKRSVYIIAEGTSSERDGPS